MPGFEISFDEERHFVTCRITRDLSEDEVRTLGADLDKALMAARLRGVVRLLWDHRGFRVLPDPLADMLHSVGRRNFREGDRAAVLVSNSLDKVQGKPKMVDEAAFFMSENAACTWLGIGTARAA